jgi:hypothetical protein
VADTRQLGSERDDVRNEGQQTGKVTLVLVTTILSDGRGSALDDDRSGHVGIRIRNGPSPLSTSTTRARVRA